ncbi:histone deacetylase [Atractiella rhizophila]|nr:histone deacetylase [Atractiella rhizophila]
MVSDDSTFSSSTFFYDRSGLWDNNASSIGESLNSKNFYAPSPNVGVHSMPRVSYYYPIGVGDFHFYSEHHPMKPHRLTLTNTLILGYGLHENMKVYSPQPASISDLTMFHGEEYIQLLSTVTPQNAHTYGDDVLRKHGISVIKAKSRNRAYVEENNDCPVFEGFFRFASMYTGASLLAAKHLSSKDTDIAINYTGGLHHGKKNMASGFCFVNDAVVAIMELLRTFPRVMYIDIDVHHGDGVQEAFYTSNRVYTISFHKYGHQLGSDNKTLYDFFPGTGHIDENGHQLGQHFSLNIPLQDGIEDDAYVALFKSIIEPAIAAFQPSVIVLQSGADSLNTDRLGVFNLTIAGHGECVRFVKSFNIPLLVLGGGGYTVRNVARCWTYETAILLDRQQYLPQDLPSTCYDAYFGKNRRLLVPLKDRKKDENTAKGLEQIRRICLEKIRYLQGAPSVQMQEIPAGLSDFLTAQETALGKPVYQEPVGLDLPARHYFDGHRDDEHPLGLPIVDLPMTSIFLAAKELPPPRANKSNKKKEEKKDKDPKSEQKEKEKEKEKDLPKPGKRRKKNTGEDGFEE